MKNDNTVGGDSGGPWSYGTEATGRGVPAGHDTGRDHVFRIVGSVVRKHVLISGLVQGVFFRDTCRRVALDSGVGGWVRNLADGRVEAVFEGPADRVDAVVAWAHRGPWGAVVRDVDVRDEQPQGLTSFLVR
ncbi:MAG TPA: acylphosphatase [Pilimelia sp.]|nr:acylphosphatase [Pilimelia sp.]